MPRAIRTVAPRAARCNGAVAAQEGTLEATLTCTMSRARCILFRLLAHWPRDRYLELAPKYWVRIRARLAAELADEFGPLTVPPPFDLTAPQQTPAD